MIRRVPLRVAIVCSLLSVAAVLVTDYVVAGRTHDYATDVEVTRGRFNDPSDVSIDIDPDGPDITPSFATVARIRDDHSIEITETIVEYFARPQRGIYRDLPIQEPDGTTHRIRSVDVRTALGTPNDVLLESHDRGLRVRIGNPDRYISGRREYQITYVYENMLIEESNGATFRLDAVSDWGVPIGQLSYRVEGPSSPLAIDCLLGESACTNSSATDTGLTVTLETSTDAPYRGADPLVVEVTYPRDEFLPSPRTMSTPWPVRPIALLAGGLVLLGGLIGEALFLRRWRRSWRDVERNLDATFSSTSRITATDLESERAGFVITHQPPIEFVPPCGLDPAQTFRLCSGSNAHGGQLMAATCLDLAARGVVELSIQDDNWTLRRRSDVPNLSPYERILLEAIVGDGDTGVMNERTDELRKVTRDFETSLDESLRERGLGRRFDRIKRPEGPSERFFALLVPLLAVVLLTGMSASGENEMAIWGAPATIWIFELTRGLFSQRYSDRHLSPLGRAALYRVRGFERFFKESEGRHARFAERSGHFREYMGFALAFGQLTEWLSVLPPENRPSEFDSLDDLIPLGQLSSISGFQREQSSSSGSDYSFDSFSSGGGGGGYGGGGGGRW